jgi:hypothetical protein
MANTTNTIEAKLTAEFATFKVDYLNQVEEWAIATQAYFQGIENEYNKVQNCKRPKQVLKTESYVLGGITRTNRYYATDFSEMTEEEVEQWNKKQDCYSILQKCTFSFGWSTEKLVEQQRTAASKWFDASVAKLAAKIQDKGINAETMTISNSHVNRNLNTLITDGDKKVKAQTIFANGAIKRPHFRYLIK